MPRAAGRTPLFWLAETSLGRSDGRLPLLLWRLDLVCLGWSGSAYRSSPYHRPPFFFFALVFLRNRHPGAVVRRYWTLQYSTTAPYCTTLHNVLC